MPSPQSIAAAYSPTCSGPPESVNVASSMSPVNCPSTAVSARPPVATTGGSETVIVSITVTGGAASWVTVTVTARGYSPVSSS